MIIHADCILAMSEMEPSSIDAIVADGPYALSFMGKEFDTFESPQAYYDFTVRWATEALRVLKPGGSLLSFGGTRTFHRLTCGLEDAGFIIKDCLMYLYGAGFPKAQDLGKMIDKRLGAEREVVGSKEGQPGYSLAPEKNPGGYQGIRYDPEKECEITAPASDLARHWDGYKVGGIKPAWEPIIWATKKPEGAMIDNCLTYGVGAVNVDETRIAGEPWMRPTTEDIRGGNYRPGEKRPKLDLGIRESHPKGRFPANLLLSHTPDCREVGTKRVKTGTAVRKNIGISQKGMNFAFGNPGAGDDVTYADSDGYETVSAWECAEDCPVRLLDEQSGVSSSKPHQGGLLSGDGSHEGWVRPSHKDGFKPWSPHSDTGGASRFFYTSKATDRQDYNDHPTLKPTDLIEWLIRLVTRPGQTVLDPFMGSGTTLVAAIQCNREAIGIEQDRHYCDIAERRIKGTQMGMF